MRVFDYTRLRKFLVVALSGLILTGILIAQIDTASIVGTVKDPSGAVIPKATVEVTSPALIGSKKLETDQGYFRFSNLPPGVYTVTVSATGFRTYKQENLTLAEGKSSLC